MIDTLKEYFDALRAATLLAGKEVLTLEEAAMYTGYSADYIRQLKMNGKIPCYKQGKSIFFRKDELVRWMTACRIPTRAEQMAEYEQKVRARRNYKSIKN